MLKYIALILKNLGRNKLRTSLTASAVIVLVAIYCFVHTVTDVANAMIDSHSSETRLLVQEKWVVPSRFPVRHVAKVAAIDGVVDWTVWHIYAGATGKGERLVTGFATRMDNFKQMHPGVESLDPSVLEQMQRERTGAILGQQMMKQLGGELGQRFTLTSVTHAGKDLEFTIVGVLPPGTWQNAFFFREDYYQEATGDREVGNVMWLRVEDVEAGNYVAAEVARMFDNNPVQLKVETESAGTARFGGQYTTIVAIIDFVATVLLANMVIALANSISITVRERRKEIAIFKVLGFQPMFIVSLIVAEAVLVGAISGVLGSALAYEISSLNGSGALGFRIDFLTNFSVPAQSIFRGLVIGAAVGFAASVLPALNIRKVKIAEVFARES